MLTALITGDDLEDAVSTPGETMSRHELLGWACAIAERIAGAERVAVDAKAGLPTIAAVTGALLAGVPIVPIPPDAGELERAHILRDSQAALLLADDAARAGESLVQRMGISDQKQSGSMPPELPEAKRPALVLYTSGTTGPPKGVVISHAALAAGLDGLAEAWQWTAEDTLVHGLPLYHVHGLVLGVLGPLRLGGRLRHTIKPTPQLYGGTPGSMYFGVPTVWSRIANAPESARALRRARLLVSGSAPLPAPVFSKIHELSGQAPVERYGMTETLITVSARADGERRAGQVGLPLSGVRTRLVDESANVLPHDGESIGTLQVAGPTLLDGYLRGDGIEAPELVDGYFPTGDVATVGPDGWHRIVGRASTDLIKTGGYRVGAGEVEDALLLHPAVREAAVIGTPHADLGEQVTAFVVASGSLKPDELIVFVAERLAAHKRPRVVRLVDELPRNGMGKVQKKLLSGF
ncbi:acyl-CoA synthetase [Actinoplanes sp. OR16]|uniref:acyl-CoA synthetase n=1 Tax=Actinoplanes sp. OR16 TaxID=946334 RepID=UPI000F70DFAD|nr:acyl-CoA synthetase [Actinoplanes sp. OR16]BBH63386.1 acyl-CoA synthetase [Actinoplanes sp. OR16]